MASLGRLLRRLFSRFQKDIKPEGSPRLNACREYGKLAAVLHHTKIVGGLDLNNCTYNPDGTIASMFSVGLGRVVEHDLTIEERAEDLAALRKQLSEPEWEAVKAGYGSGAKDEVGKVLSLLEARSDQEGPTTI